MRKAIPEVYEILAGVIGLVLIYQESGPMTAGGVFLVVFAFALKHHNECLIKK